jgi:hypothetical protein
MSLRVPKGSGNPKQKITAGRLWPREEELGGQRMNLQHAMTKMKDTVRSIRDKVALTILIWLEKEPSQERILPPPQSWEVHRSYLRYRGRSVAWVRRSEKDLHAL